MRSSSLNTSLASNSGNQTGSRGISNPNKPPIPPKPSVQNRHRIVSEQNPEVIEFPNGICSPGYYPVSKYSSYPTAVLIKDDTIPYITSSDFDSKGVSALETLTPLASINTNYERGKFSGSLTNLPQITHQGIPPPLTKAELIPRSNIMLTQVNPQIYELQSNPRTGNLRTVNASAKNALLMEKLGGSYATFNNSKEILPRANSNPETGSSLPVTVNKSCIISVNNFNNSFNNNNCNDSDTRNNRSKQRRSLNLDNNKLSTCREVIINSVPIAATVALMEKETLHDYANHSPLPVRCTSCNNYSKGCHCTKENKPLQYIFNGSKRKEVKDQLEVPVYSNGDSHHEMLSNNGLQNNSLAGLEKTLFIDQDRVDSASDRHSLRLASSLTNLMSSQSAPCSPALKPLLQKSDAVDIEDSEYYKRLSRGISRATDNVNIVSKARSEIAQGIWEALESGSGINNTPFFLETPVLTFTLPDLNVYSDEFRAFLEKDLIEMSTLVSLEAAGRLNWWAMIGASQRLWPLATTGDGNCLLHAASLGMWGFHDRLLTLRKALHEFLTRSQFSRPLWRRWRWQLTLQNKETGLVLSQDEWDSEWENVIRLASSAPRGGSQPPENITSSAPNLSQTSTSLSQGKLNSEYSGPVYESLEEIHVLALAHILRRPVIVVADTTLKDIHGDPLAPIPFGGIYLPIECPPRECQRSPLLLTYDAAHFSALVVMETNDKDVSKTTLPAVIPVSDCFHDLLPIQFVNDPGEDFVWGRDELDPRFIQKITITTQDKKGLLNEYLDLIQVPIPSTYLEASMQFGTPHDDPLNGAQGDTLSPHNGHPEPYLDHEKKSSESSFDSDDSPHVFGDMGLGGAGPGVSRPSKQQLQTVVRSFGSLGRSMSKRIKKNLNSLSKLSRSGSFRRKNPGLMKGGEYPNGALRGTSKCPVKVGTQQNFILGAVIHTDKRQAYQQEMIENYLATARERFMRNGGLSQQVKETYTTPSTTDDPVQITLTGESDPKEMLQCINSGCEMFGSASTSYMCTSCFNRQRDQEEKEYQRQLSGGEREEEAPHPTVDGPLHPVGRGVDGLQYGAGRSKFYAALDENSMKSATLIPVTQSVSSGTRDKTLFLSNSIFYNDSNPVATSYNLSRDLYPRDPRRGKKEGGAISDSSISSRSSSALSDPVQVNLSLRDPSREAMAPICINEGRVQVALKGGARNGPTKSLPQSKACVSASLRTQSKDGLASARHGRGGDATPATIHSPNTTTVDCWSYSPSSKPCLTKGCQFYGSAATDNLCSKCHAGRRKAASAGSEAATSAEQVKFVLI